MTLSNNKPHKKRKHAVCASSEFNNIQLGYSQGWNTVAYKVKIAHTTLNKCPHYTGNCKSALALHFHFRPTVPQVILGFNKRGL